MKKQRINPVLVCSIARKLRRIRKEKGITQIDAYIDTDIHVSRIEMGRTNISISTLSDLCDYYGVTLQDFFADLEMQESDTE